MSYSTEIIHSKGWNGVAIDHAAADSVTGLPHVIFVGRIHYSTLFDSLLSNGAPTRLSYAANYRELWAIPNNASPRLVVLYDTLHAFELEASCRLTRRRWPDARVLVIRSSLGNVDRSLYDVRLPSSVSPHVLLMNIRKYAADTNSRAAPRVKPEG